MGTVLKKHRECFSWLVVIAVALLSQDVDAQMTVTQGNISVARTRLQPGQSIDLRGEWLYRPGLGRAGRLPRQRPGLLAINLLRAAAEASSTTNLPVVPSHQKSLTGRRTPAVK